MTKSVLKPGESFLGQVVFLLELSSSFSPDRAGVPLPGIQSEELTRGLLMMDGNSVILGSGGW